MICPKKIAFRGAPVLHCGDKFLHNGHVFTIEKFHGTSIWVTFEGWTDRMSPRAFFAAFGPSLPGWDSKIHKLQ